MEIKEANLLKILMVRFAETGVCAIEINASTYYRPGTFKIRPAHTVKNRYLIEEGLEQSLVTKTEARKEIRSALKDYCQAARENGWKVNHFMVV
jgi:hypothetical protein